ncbi:hypothetical protein [Desulforamulus aquiferis]|uniref:AbiTii domain-containing protein n=1 Tax=Desulforamulus aquiferis TaxID=1397668 RepID=A0AAW7ZAV5_9FIRM|nr:hypothetical protein [Desulforamulus aquiferis]MDO7786239.1 hypothetical protein [Desulforamulus aquiferis]RYD01746.1 hypothetical protein N752_28230 [Desulforamulus aquiferis]
MVNHDSIWEPADYKSEMFLNNIIEASHRTIDWSVNLYFKTMEKAVPLFCEKLVQDDKFDFYHGFASHIFNETEMGQLIHEIENHINKDILSLQNKWLPSVKFKHEKVIPSFEIINESIYQHKITLQLAKHAEKAVCDLTTKALIGISPVSLPKKLVAKATPSIGKTISRTMAIDKTKCTCEYQTNVENQLHCILQIILQDLKANLKHQLAEQLYSWYDKLSSQPFDYQNQIV